MPIPTTFHHLHFNATDPKAAADWYAEHFGMEAIPVDDRLTAAWFPGTDDRAPCTFLWSRAQAPGPSIGTTLDHYGWSVEDLDTDTQRLEAAGCELVGEPVTIGPSPTGDTLRISFLIDPFGVKFELVEDPDLLGFHHIHLLTPDTDGDRVQWINTFGGTAATFKGFLPGIRHEHSWVLFRESEQSLAPTSGRTIDHYAFGVDDVAVALTQLEDQGFSTRGPEPSSGGRTIGFVEVGTGASGAVTVELVQEAR